MQQQLRTDGFFPLRVRVTDQTVRASTPAQISLKHFEPKVLCLWLGQTGELTCALKSFLHVAPRRLPNLTHLKVVVVVVGGFKPAYTAA